MKVVRIFDHGDGTVRTHRDDAFDITSPLAVAEVGRLTIALKGTVNDIVYPVCDQIYWAWDGVKLIEASTQVKAAVDAKIAAAAASDEAASLPAAAWSKFTRFERFILLVVFRLAKLHYPALTREQFVESTRTEWEAAK